jgi:tRNA nucleotidyltransferase/poly(A) polymerase
VNISLTEQEEQIFKTLLEVVEENDLGTTLRVAGGWVRDKVRLSPHKKFYQILGKESKDIDVTLDNMMGQEFAGHLSAKLYPEAKE